MTTNDFYTPGEDQRRLEKTCVPTDERLPRVLILGDSISIGYAPFVMQRLAGKANVELAANCGDTKRGLARLDEWLGDGQWDIIHFNFGLHDICYRHPESKVQGHRDKERGSIGVPLEQYEKNLGEIVRRFERLRAALIWASTTVVPEAEAGRFVGDEVKYNAAAEKIMKKHGVPINDLHSVSSKFDSGLFVKPGDVHFTKEGYEVLALHVNDAISAVLTERM